MVTSNRRGRVGGEQAEHLLERFRAARRPTHHLTTIHASSLRPDQPTAAVQTTSPEVQGSLRLHQRLM
jgi:hypothetical protein